MRRFSYLLLLFPVFLLAGCEGVVVDLGQESQVPLEPESQTNPEPQLDKREVLVFSAKWCPPCIRDKPQVDELRRQGVKVTIIDYDENPEMFRRYRVTQMPTYVVLDENGVEIQRTGSITVVLSIVSVILKIVLFFLG